MLLKKIFKKNSIFNNQDYIYLNLSYVIQCLFGFFIILNILLNKDFYYLGIFTQIYTFFIIIGHLFAFGIGDSLMRNIPIYTKNNQKKIFTSAIFLGFFLGTTFLIVIYFFMTIYENVIFKYKYIFNHYLLFSILIFSINKIHYAFFNSQRKIKIFSFMNALRPILIFIFLVVIIKYYSKEYLAIIFFYTELIIFFICLYLSSSFLTFKFNLFKYLNLNFMFGRKILLNNILAESLIKVDIICLSIFLNPFFVGIYSLGSFFFEGFYQFLISIKNNINPQLSRLYHKKKYDDIFTLSKISQKISFYLSLIFFILNIVIYFFIREFELNFEESAIILIILSLGILFYSLIIPIENIFAQINKPNIQSLYMSSLFVLNVFFNIIFIRKYGVYGAAIGTSCSYLISIFIFYIILKKNFITNNLKNE